MPSSQLAADSGPVKIAFCITELDPGGAERALVELVTRLNRKRFLPVVYCLAQRPRSNPISLADRLEASGVTVHCFGARGWRNLPSVASRLVRQIKADAPEIVQAFLFHANVLGAWAARRAKVPCVVTGIRVAERRAGWHLRVARWADRFVDSHVCVSESVRDFSVKQGHLPSEKLVVIPNAIEVARYAEAAPASRSELGVSADSQVIMCIGRMDHQKGIDWLLEVMREVERRVSRSELLLVGDGPLRSELEALAKRLQLGRVRFLGFRRDIPELLATSDLVVLPSRWEGMPNVVLEAMAAGRAIVATDVEGVDELLVPSGSEQVVTRDNPSLFAERIVTLLADGSLRQRLGAANLSRAQSTYSHAATVAAYEQLYAQLLSRPG